MNDIKIRFLTVVMCSAMLIMSGCMASTARLNPEDEVHYDAGYDFSDKKQIVDRLVNPLLAASHLLPSQVKPILIVYPVVNETSEHISTAAITDEIRMKLINSGKIRFINEHQRENIMREISYQTQGFVDPALRVEEGRQLGADYILSGTLRSIKKKQPNDAYPDALDEDYFTRALVALCFENMNLRDDARIEYDLLSEDMGVEVWMPDPIAPGKGELVLFIGQGNIPAKISVDAVLPPSIRISIPQYTASYSPLSVTVRSHRGMLSSMQIPTDLGDVARESLSDRAAQILVRQTLRAGLKEFIAQRVSEKYEFAEPAIKTLLFLSEEADTRSWETLPGSLIFVRLTLDSGVHDLEICSEYSGTVYLYGLHIPEAGRLYRSLRF